MIHFLKKYIGIVIGVIIITLFIGGLGICRLAQGREWNDNQKFTKEMLREHNVETLESPFVAAEYFINAILNKDVDKALRGCAIDERCLNSDYKLLMKRKAEKKLHKDIAPSAEEDACYYPINSAIFTEEYYEQISVLIKMAEEKELAFDEVNYIKKSTESLEKYKEEKELSKAWGAEEVEEVLIKLLDKSGENYIVALSVAKYEYGWKIFQVGSSEMGMTYREPIKRVSEKEYEESIDKKKSKKKNNEKMTDKILPLNYFKISQKEEKNITRVVEEFTTCLQRQDIKSAMNYLEIEENEDFFERQREIAEKMKDFCKGIMGIRDTNRNSRLWNTEELTYITLNGVYDIDKNISKERIIVYYFDGNFYALGCRFAETEGGWMIKEFVNIGNEKEKQFVIPITTDELEKLQEGYRNNK